MWSEAKTPDGKSYYHNSQTNETTWTKPEAMMTPLEVCNQTPTLSRPFTLKFYSEFWQTNRGRRRRTRQAGNTGIITTQKSVHGKCQRTTRLLLLLRKVVSHRHLSRKSLT